MRVFELHIRGSDYAFATLRRLPRSRHVDVLIMIKETTRRVRVPVGDAAALERTARDMEALVAGSGTKAWNTARDRSALELMRG